MQVPSICTQAHLKGYSSTPHRFEAVRPSGSFDFLTTSITSLTLALSVSSVAPRHSMSSAAALSSAPLISTKPQKFSFCSHSRRLVLHKQLLCWTLLTGSPET